MKWSFAGVAAIVLGLVGFAILILFQNITTRNEQDYYELKEVAFAAMYDSIDWGYTTGLEAEPKINKEKFVENFIRRFSETITLNTKNYKIEFYDIIEVPPKASIRIYTQTETINVGGVATEFDIVNEINVMFETDF